jgi:hypothetical protein
MLIGKLPKLWEVNERTMLPLLIVNQPHIIPKMQELRKENMSKLNSNDLVIKSPCPSPNKIAVTNIAG